MRLNDKVAIVTGAGSGIGRGICVRFAEEGANIVAADINRDGAERTAALVGELGRQAVVVTADVSRRADVQRIFTATLQRFKTFDILVNNAGILTYASILELTEEAWDKVMGTNLKSMFHCTQEAARYWVREKRPGKIVNLGSLNSELAIAGIPHYCASKGGVRMFTRACALDLAPYKINVNAIGPGGTQTNIIPLFQDPAGVEQVAKSNPWGRIGQPRDIANMALFLASDEADYITGELFMVTGGATAGISRGAASAST